MEEKGQVKNQAKKEPYEPKKGKKKDDSVVAKLSGGLVTKWKDTVGEFKKIIWPDKKALAKHTVNVIVTSAIMGAVIVGMDYLFSFGYSLLAQLS
ncbi:MAG: preprotein translocase subunit SecE [Clostridiales bacterium]|jgi:preprotein translocase subunit SecE|nr:preprotein translocase subunit SecE [Clostridiales bacterium]